MQPSSFPRNNLLALYYVRRFIEILWRWQFFCLLLVTSAFLGAGWEWYSSRADTVVRGGTLSSTKKKFRPNPPLIPNSFQGLPAFLTGANGPLEPAGRKQARLAEEARTITRQLVKPDRSNVDCSHMKCIALTYDDGPEPELTVQLLKILREKQTVATFFVVGDRIQTQASTLKQAVAEHNEIGNHTWSHHDLTRMTDQQIREDIDRTNNLIRETVGFQPKLMRPPMGRYNQRVMDVVHMPLALWSVDPRDWRDRDSQTIYLRTISAASPGKIILLHDMHPTTVQASTWIIDELQRQGYVLVTMSELFNITESNLQDFTGRMLLFR